MCNYNRNTELRKICYNDVTYTEEAKNIILWVTAVSCTTVG